MDYDIIVIWWWPAWCSTAIMLKQYWYSVAIYEKDSFPKHNIWESFLPIVNSDYMKVIWLDEDIRNMWFEKKYWNTFIWWNDREPWSLFFDKRLNADQKTFSEEDTKNILTGDYTHSYQVNRYDFDMLFINKAKSLWIDIFENTKISKVQFNNKSIEELELEDGSKVKAKFYVDASWQIAKIANTLWERTFNKDLWFSATYWYFKNCNFLDNFLSKHTQYIVSTELWWIWFIYIWNNVTSIWLVSDKKNISNTEFLNTLDSVDEISKLTKWSSLVDSLWNKTNEIKKARNRSYSNKSLYWDNYLLVWDAAGFVDPILSWWLSLALMSWITWSAFIDHYMKNQDSKKLKEYEEIIFKDIDNYYKLAKYWYWNNKSTQSWFWKAKNILWYDISNIYNKRAFAFLASGKHYTNKNFEIFNELRINNFAYNFEDIDEINHLFTKNHKSEDILKIYKNLYNDKNEEYIKSVKELWKQVKIIEKMIQNLDSNFSQLFTYYLNNSWKISIFEYVFSHENFLLLTNIDNIDKNKKIKLMNEMLYLIINQWWNNKIYLNDFDINIYLNNNFRLSNWLDINIMWLKELNIMSKVSFKNNKIVINNVIFTKEDFKINLDNFIW